MQHALSSEDSTAAATAPENPGRLRPAHLFEEPQHGVPPQAEVAGVRPLKRVEWIHLVPAERRLSRPSLSTTFDCSSCILTAVRNAPCPVPTHALVSAGTRRTPRSRKPPAHPPVPHEHEGEVRRHARHRRHGNLVLRRRVQAERHLVHGTGAVHKARQGGLGAGGFQPQEGGGEAGVQRAGVGKPGGQGRRGGVVKGACGGCMWLAEAWSSHTS